MKVTFKILRSQPNFPPKFQFYTLEVEKGNTILDCLNRIKWELDGTLAFRKNCRNTICGSCAMKINGRAALACKENVGGELEKLGFTEGENPPLFEICPLNNLPVLKDLVVDMDNFWQDLEKIEPYVVTKEIPAREREFLQTPEERKLLTDTSNCIMCGACYSQCNAKEVNPFFVGPHALAKSYRLLADSRDNITENRLEKYNDIQAGVWGCTRCYFCDEVCPMGVAPLTQITKIKQLILQKQDTNSTPIRHRKLLVDMVKQGGWIDERRFAVTVISNYFRDLKALLTIAPLGLRMILAGKFPFTFQPSQGVWQINALIQDIQRETHGT